jgi:hypothetical protein
MMPAAACVHCVAGLKPVKMKRQWVHHFSGDGRITVCADRHLKPERLAAAAMTTHGPVTVATNGPDF